MSRPKSRLADFGGLLPYLPQVLVFPLRLSCVGAILLFSLMFWVGLHGLFGVILLAIATPWLLAWLERIIDDAADGAADAPVFGGKQMFLASAAGWRLLIGPMLILSLWWSLRTTHPALSGLAVMLGCFLFPAYMLLAVQFGLSSALNPLRLAATVVVCGWPYLLACALLSALGLALLATASGLSLFSAIVALLSLLVLSAHLVGAIAFFRAEALGLPPRLRTSHAEDERAAAQSSELDRILGRVRAQLADGDLNAACAALVPAPGRVDRAIDFAEALFERVHQRTHKVVILCQGAHLITLLAARKRYPLALEVFRRCLDHSPAAADYLPNDVRLRLAEFARSAGAFAPFERLTAELSGLDSRQPEVTELRLLAASDLIERRADPVAARALLADLDAAADDPLAPRLVALKRLLG